MSASISCPYPYCGRKFDANVEDRCACEYRQPFVRCGTCVTANRSGARYCRACRSELHAAGPRRGPVGIADFLTMQGSFRRPPLAGNGFLYGLSKDGNLSQISSRTGAQAREITHFESGTVGFNRAAVVHVGADDIEEGNADLGLEEVVLRGWMFLAIGETRVEAVSLIDCKAGVKSTVFYEAQPGEAIVANRNEGEATSFKGLVANHEFVAFILRKESGENLLTLQYLNRERPLEQPLMLDGGQVAGPAMCNRQIAFCTKRQVGLYDEELQMGYIVALPDDFQPLFSSSSEDLRVPPGSMPFAFEPKGASHAIHIAGELRGKAGLLRVDFEADESAFRAVPKGSSLSTASDGVACLNVRDAIEVFGVAGVEIRRTTAQAGMPAYYTPPHVCSFGEVDFVGRHRLQLEASAGIVEMQFEDDRCSEDSCCGVYVIGRDVLVAYLDIKASDQGAGMRMARWTLQ